MHASTLLLTCMHIGPSFRHELEGDPSSWARMMHMLKTVRDAVAQCDAAMVVAVVQRADAGELLPERVTGVCHNLGLEPR
jgi:hypothetical protein